MDDSALDKLIADIQDFLREAEDKKVAPPAEPVRESAPQVPRTVSRSLRRSAQVARLLEVAAFAWAAFIVGIVCYLVWTEPLRDAASAVQLGMLCTFGLFTTLALIGGAHRISALLRIERNTREILRLRRRQNVLLSRIADRQQ